jgi:hypothetical protein
MDPVMFIFLGTVVILAVLILLYMLYIIGNTLVIKWKEEPHGIAPVQAEGYFMGKYFYFRSRYERAVIQFADSEEDWKGVNILKKYVVYKTYNLYKASSIPYWKAKLLIYKGCLMYLLNFKSNV